MIVVEKPGLRTTVQDRGRIGLAHLGVPRSGAADWFSARLANALVGNPAGAAVLETTLTGPALRFETAALVAVTGAAADVLLDGDPIELGVITRVFSGQRLSIGSARDGLRSYLAVAGGIDVPPVLGSRSTDTLSGIGPPPLAPGDTLPIGAAPTASSGSVDSTEIFLAGKEMVASVLSVPVAVGDPVVAGDTVILLESMKMEIPVLAEVDGTVAEIRVEPGDVIQEGDVLHVVMREESAG